jgi:hypothetical protein
MIVTRIMGGLGNQLFQCAAGLALAARHGVGLKFDLRWMSRYRRRPYLLDRFPLPAARLTIGERLAHTWFPFPRNPPFLYIKATRRLNRRIYLEPGHAYDPAFAALGPDRFLWGYFQSERYFEACRTLVRAELSGRADRSRYDPGVLAAIDDEASVAVQFRRGDYVTDPDTSRSLGVCHPDYYRDAVAVVRERVSAPRWVVFSDDVPWCRANVELEGAVYVERSGGTPVDDLFLAASCRHIILANSTFSWWSAWLNENPGLVAVAPRRWFRDPVLHEQSGDLIPGRWHRV